MSFFYLFSLLHFSTRSLAHSFLLLEQEQQRYRAVVDYVVGAEEGLQGVLFIELLAMMGGGTARSR